MQSSVEQLNKRVVLTSEKVMYEGANIEVLQMFTRFSMKQPYHLGAVFHPERSDLRGQTCKSVPNLVSLKLGGS